MRLIIIGTSRDIEFDVRNAFFGRLQQMPLGYYQARRTGDLMSRATNDLNERYIGGDDIVASPIFPIVPAFQFLMKAGMDPELEADLMRLVHGEEEHVLHKPIRPGDTLTLKPVIESITAATPSGGAVSVLFTT